MMIMVVVVVVVVIAFKGANRDFFFSISSLRREPSPTRTLKWPGQHTQRLSRATRYVPRGTKGQLSY